MKRELEAIEDEADVIEEAVCAAFAEHVKTLYKTMISNLVAGYSEKDCVERYQAGLDIAFRAVSLALAKEQPK